MQVTVRTCSARSEGGETWVWEAVADSPTYTLRLETDEAKQVERGTSVELHLKVGGRVDRGGEKGERKGEKGSVVCNARHSLERFHMPSL